MKTALVLVLFSFAAAQQGVDLSSPYVDGAYENHIQGMRTTYKVTKAAAAAGAAVVEAGDTVTVHATGVVKETGKTFWVRHYQYSNSGVASHGIDVRALLFNFFLQSAVTMASVSDPLTTCCCSWAPIHRPYICAVTVDQRSGPETVYLPGRCRQGDQGLGPRVPGDGPGGDPQAADPGDRGLRGARLSGVGDPARRYARLHY